MTLFHEIIKRPLVTEKSIAGRAAFRYTFEVARTASKPVIAKAIEQFFKVKVVSVHTVSVAGKQRRYGSHVGRTETWKKAMVTLKEGQKIELLEAE